MRMGIVDTYLAKTRDSFAKLTAWEKRDCTVALDVAIERYLGAR